MGERSRVIASLEQGDSEQILGTRISNHLLQPHAALHPVFDHVAVHGEQRHPCCGWNWGWGERFAWRCGGWRRGGSGAGAANRSATAEAMGRRLLLARLLGMTVSSEVSRVDGRLAGEVSEAGSEVEVDGAVGLGWAAALLAGDAVPPSLHQVARR